MMDFLFSSPLLPQPFSGDNSENPQAFLGRSPKNKSQPKKLMPKEDRMRKVF
jgi:hypothetical protein